MGPPSTDTDHGSARWRDVVDGLSGRPREYTKGPLWPGIVALAVPMVLEMLMQSVFEIADIWFVGRLGPEAVAAVGLSAALVVLVFAVAIGLSMGAQAMVARRIGEGDREAAGIAAWHAVIAGIVVSTVVGIAGVAYAGPLLRLMGATETVISVGTPYFAVMIGTNITITLLFLLNAVFRGAGDASIAMRALWIANILNVVLDPVFIFGFGPVPALGVAGAAIATTLARAIGIAFQVWVLVKGHSRLRRPAGGFRFDSNLIVRLAKVAGPGMIQFLVGASSFIVMTRLVAWFGSDSVAGYTIAFRIIVFVLLPAWGLANATATLTGQNLGAGNPDRAEQAVWMCARLSVGVLIVVGSALFFAAPFFIGLFTDSPAVVEVGASCLAIFAVAFPLRGAALILVQAFNGAGDTTTPTWINLAAYWVVQIPVALGLAHGLGWGTNGLFLATAVANAAAAVMAWLRFRRGDWRELEV